jgi:hypothetical protein
MQIKLLQSSKAFNLQMKKLASESAEIYRNFNKGMKFCDNCSVWQRRAKNALA